MLFFGSFELTLRDGHLMHRDDALTRYIVGIPRSPLRGSLEMTVTWPPQFAVETSHPFSNHR